jgi:outer membrane protein assembly factor BamB
LAVADLALRRGYYWTAIAALRRLDPRWQAVAEPAAAAAEQKLAAAEVAGLGWEFILAGLDAAQFAELRTYLLSAEQTRAAWPLGCYVGSELPPAAIGLRLVIAYRGAGERVTAARLAQLLAGWYADAEVMYGGKAMPLAEALRAIDSAAERVAEWPPERVAGTQWSTLGQDGQRVYHAPALGELPLLPSWRVELEVVETVPRTLPTEPPVGAATTTADRLRDQRPAADIWPIIHDGLVIGQAGDAIYAWQLESGQPWPTGERGVPLFASPRGAALRPVAGELPVDRRPQFSLSAARGRVAVRLGPPESGWLTVARPTQALSQLAVLDLQQEGRLLDGYPAQWSVPQRQAFYEFEGAPLIVGERLYVGVNQRDQANERSSVACFDVASGALLFQSPTLGAARPLVETSSHRLGHAVVSYREGIVYYQGDGGVVAAIDGLDGSLRWLLRYPRAELADSGYPRRRRAAVKRSSPIAIAGPLAIVMAADLDRLVGLDAATGCVVWASEPGQVDDVDQILGRQDQWLIAGGDSLSWIDRQTGLVVGQWPAGSSRQPHGALPQPRRAGRGVMAGDKIYWPTNDAIWIFAAKPASQAGMRMIVPRPLRRIELAASGLRGGDLITADGVLVMSQGSTIAAFKSLD